MGHNGKSSCFPIMFPHKHLWVKAPWCSPQQDDTHSITTLAAFPPSSALLPPSPKPPQTNPWLHSSTLFRHNPQAPRSTTCVYRIRACGFTTKTQQEDTSLACTVAPGELGLEELSDGGWGWPLVVMPWRSWCLWAMPRAVVPGVGAGSGENRLGADLASCTWPNGLMVESDALSQSLKIRVKNQKWRKWWNWGQQREVIREGVCAAEWLSYVLNVFFCSLHYWNAQSTGCYPMQFSAHSVAICMWILILKD